MVIELRNYLHRISLSIVKLTKGESASILTTLYLSINSSIFLRDSVTLEKKGWISTSRSIIPSSQSQVLNPLIGFVGKLIEESENRLCAQIPQVYLPRINLLVQELIGPDEQLQEHINLQNMIASNL